MWIKEKKADKEKEGREKEKKVMSRLFIGVTLKAV